MLPDLDPYDRRILDLLQSDSSRSNVEIANEIGLSEAPCWRRIQRLKKEGLIKAQVSLLDRSKLGLNIQVFALIKLTAVGRSNLSDFAREISEFPEVLECYVVMGNTDFMLRIVARDIQAYEHFMFERLSQVPGVQDINSLATLSEIKATTQLPLDL